MAAISGMCEASCGPAISGISSINAHSFSGVRSSIRQTSSPYVQARSVGIKLEPTIRFFGLVGAMLTGCTAHSLDPFDKDNDGYFVGEDCNDTDPVIGPRYIDNDRDGYGAGDPLSGCSGTSADGYSTHGGDCDDSSASRSPSQPEVCDSIDNDCDNEVDDALVYRTYYHDADSDGFGDSASPVESCLQEIPACTTSPLCFADNSNDCDDANSDVHPAADEVCDGYDQDCDGYLDDDAIDASSWYLDSDGDGFGDYYQGIGSIQYSCIDPSTDEQAFTNLYGDCDDTSETAYPGATEFCDNIDSDCDGKSNEVSPSYGIIYFRDSDGDGFGDPDATLEACSTPAGYSTNDSDCDDQSETTYPCASERCNGIDDDCDGNRDNGWDDLDLSGTPDCREVIVIISYGFSDRNLDASDRCGQSKTYVEEELSVILSYLSDSRLGDLQVITEYEDEDDDLALKNIDLSFYPLIIYDTGGIPSRPRGSTVEKIQQAIVSGTGLILIGDDLGLQADEWYDFASDVADYGAPELYPTLALFDPDSIDEAEVGTANIGASVAASDHPLITGVGTSGSYGFGTVIDFAYAADLDLADMLPSASAVMKVSGTSFPAVIAYELETTQTQRTVTLLPSMYAAVGVCPVSDSIGIVTIETLMKNAVAWSLEPRLGEGKLNSECE